MEMEHQLLLLYSSTGVNNHSLTLVFNSPSTTTSSSTMDTRNTSQIYDEVAKHYSAASQTTSVKYGETVAKSFGYTEEELANIPEGANLGLSCGNPLAITSLREVTLIPVFYTLLFHRIFLFFPKKK